MQQKNRMAYCIPWLICLIALLGFLGAAVAQNEAKTALPETEAALVALESPPPLPENITNTGDLIMQVALGKLTQLEIEEAEVAPLPEGVEEIKDIQYGDGEGTPLYLDLYLPQDRKEPIPGLIFIHGGGWSGGKRSDYRYYAMRMPQMGYAVATVSYRLVPKAIFPAAVQDVKCAVRWMRANAKKYGIDPDKLAAIGGSAGGHLSLMLGYSAGVPELEGNGGHQEYSSAVQAVVDLYGPVDITLPEHRDNPTLLAFFGGKHFDEAPDQYRMASPITHLTKDAPPTLIIQGTDDMTVPVDQSDMLAERLKELGVDHEYLRLEGHPHTLDIVLETNLYCRWHIYRFLDKYLRQKD